MVAVAVAVAVGGVAVAVVGVGVAVGVFDAVRVGESIVLYLEIKDEDVMSLPQQHLGVYWAEELDSLAAVLHGNARGAGWYNNPKTGKSIRRNAGEMIALIHSELSEMLEGVRRPQESGKLPGLTLEEEEEAADVLIRLLDYCAYRKIRIGEAVARKANYNISREDHKLENRAKGGKKF